jgi:poly(hydroxyalkanoate) depolymerase family esterase
MMLGMKLTVVTILPTVRERHLSMEFAMRRSRAALTAAILALFLAVGWVALSQPAAAASLVEVTNFGTNPGGMRMHVYAPDTRPGNPAIVVAMHGCGGSGPGFYSGSEFASLADRYGFVVIYPTATQQAGFGNCFDVWSDASKRRDGGSDPVSIMSMVTYVQRQYGGDPQRVFATGSSSGGMMTNALLALYPDVFKAGAAFMGVPFACFAGAADFPPSSSRCTGGSMNRTPQEWGDAVRQAYPGYTGARPRVQLWHGTNDTLVPYSLLQEAIEQWTNVFGLGQTPTSTDTPQANWNRRRYADRVEAYSIQGAGHSLPSGGMALAAVQFFGIDRSTPGSPSASVSPSSSSSSPGTAACRVAYRPDSWGNGFTAAVTVTNAGSGAINGWTLQWTWSGNQQVTNAWNATVAQTGNQVSARNASWNATINPGQSASFGFQATYSGSNNAPTQFVLNGAPCS